MWRRGWRGRGGEEKQPIGTAGRGAARPEPVIPGLPITQRVANQRGPWCSTSLYLGKCGGGCALAAEERERERERGRERGRERESERGSESANEGAERAPAATPLRLGQRQRRRCTLRAVQRAHWSGLCIKDPLYAHTHLHLHQCTLLPPPPPDNCWEKNKTPAPTASNKRQPRAPAIATSEKCTIARSFPRTEQNLKRKDQRRRRRAGASLSSPHTRAASITTPSRTTKSFATPEENERNVFLRRRAASGRGEERSGCWAPAVWSRKKGAAAFFVVSRETSA
ncbi:uncharacterized protein LOC121491744 [Vulpes lagopus]|uniref:uncharacterized protein LOC121491744 n=1 Tax=Vulpes lagopus TaxID=494514 RepID=UPI001BC8F5E3|nr:uncharacterized protein LOC121491744 [Vulpes lagopus]